MKSGRYFMNLGRYLPMRNGVWIAFAPVLLLFVLLASHDIDIPGLYMDAVNPDYMAARIIRGDSSLPAWIMPGNALFGYVPVLVQLYHGAVPLYIGLPIYALFGTDVVGVRLANLVFGSIVLLACTAFLRSFGVSRLIVIVCLAALAVDPGFLFSWRTQFYITLLPLAFVLASVWIVQTRRLSPSRHVAALSGCAAGFAVYGYFFYAFFVPACAAFALLAWRDQPRVRALCGWWVGGLACGVAPYAAGLLLVASATGGLHQGLDYIRGNMSQLTIKSDLSFYERVDYLMSMIRLTVLGVGPSAMLLRSTPSMAFSFVKIGLLLAVPGLGAAISVKLRAMQSSGLLVITGFVAGFSALYLIFGNRLWLHHAAPLLPLLYLALALVLELLIARMARLRRVPMLSASGLAVAALFVVDAGACAAMFRGLERTGGVGLASDAIERFARDAATDPSPTRAFFPDWGVFMPFEMVTKGKVPLSTDFSPPLARNTLCQGQDVLLALLDSTRPDRLQDWIDRIGWGQPETRTYDQRDGVAVLTAARWRAAASPHAPC